MNRKTDCRVPEPNGIDCSNRLSALVPGQLLPPLVTHVMVRMEMGADLALACRWVWAVASTTDRARLNTWINVHVPSLAARAIDEDKRFARLVDMEQEACNP
jgi:hypothetical protein